MDSFRYTLVAIILACVSYQVENFKIRECSLKGIEFQQCLNQVQSADSLESCCRTLNQAVQAGYSCLCLLLSSSTPIKGITLSMNLSNCYISMPSLTHCHKPIPGLHTPELTPVPSLNYPPDRPLAVQMPPEIPKEQPQPSAPNDLIRPLPPKMSEIPLNSSPIKNSTTAAGQPTLNSNSLPESSISEREEKICSGGDKCNTILHPRFLLAVALFAITVVCY